MLEGQHIEVIEIQSADRSSSIELSGSRRLIDHREDQRSEISLTFALSSLTLHQIRWPRLGHAYSTEMQLRPNNDERQVASNPVGSQTLVGMTSPQEHRGGVGAEGRILYNKVCKACLKPGFKVG